MVKFCGLCGNFQKAVKMMIWLISQVWAEPQVQDGQSQETLVEPFPLQRIAIAALNITVEVADEPHERHLGLMYRKEMPKDHGMIFVYPDEKIRNFWMKNTYIPLSIAYLDAEGIVLHLADMTPLNLDPVSSIYPAQYALEMNRGWFSQHQVTIGTQIDVSDLKLN